MKILKNAYSTLSLSVIITSNDNLHIKGSLTQLGANLGLTDRLTYSQFIYFLPSTYIKNGWNCISGEGKSA